jgi:hypothetical protein
VGNHPEEVNKTGGAVIKTQELEAEHRKRKQESPGIAILISLLLLFPCCALAIGTSLWKVRDFEKCELQGVMLDKDGFASLAPKIECLWENPDVYVWTMLQHGKTLYMGTGGEGRVYRMENGKSSLLFDTKEAGVFSLGLREGNIYAGTSPNGKIFVIDHEGKGKIFTETNEKYVWEMCFDNRDNLYAGTGTSGRILKMTRDGKLDTFYTTGQMNVPFLARSGSHFYAGTGEDGIVLKINGKGEAFCLYDAPEDEITGVVPVDSLLFVAATGDTHGSIYVIHPDSRVEKIWRINSQIKGIHESGSVIIAAAGKRVYRIDRTGSSELLTELPTPISCIVDGWIGTSEKGKVYKLTEKTCTEGTVESPSHDTKSISKWGKLEAKGTPGIGFRTRTGNLEKPDSTWDKWRSVGRDNQINSLPARFIQWEARMTSASSQLKEVRIPFLVQNEKPDISEIKIVPRTGKGKNRSKTSKVVWKVKDANSDSLSFDLSFRLTTETEWTSLKKSIRDTSYSIDPRSFPDGSYQFRVIASDSPSNPLEYALTHEKISEPCFIDNTPPIIKMGEVKSNALSFEVKDNRSIQSCGYALDGAGWQIAFPVDNMFDSTSEKFRIKVGKARKVVVRAQDRCGNRTLKSKLLRSQ